MNAEQIANRLKQNEIQVSEEVPEQLCLYLNLLTESNKSSYIDSYLQRAVNATELSVGINNTLHGVSDKYAWFLS